MKKIEKEIEVVYKRGKKAPEKLPVPQNPGFVESEPIAESAGKPIEWTDGSDLGEIPKKKRVR